MENDTKHPTGYIVIPALVRNDTSLSPAAKLLYGEITALCNNSQSYCWAKNEYFAKLFGCSTSSVSRWLAELAKGGYINVALIRNEKNVIIERRVYNTLISDGTTVAKELTESSAPATAPQNEDGCKFESVSGVTENEGRACGTITVTITQPIPSDADFNAGFTPKRGVIKNENTCYQNRKDIISNLSTPPSIFENRGVIKNESENNNNLRLNNYNNILVLNNNAPARMNAEEFDKKFHTAAAACLNTYNGELADGYNVVREFLLDEINCDRLKQSDLSASNVCTYVVSLYVADKATKKFYPKHISDIRQYLLKCLENTRKEQLRQTHLSVLHR